MREGEKAYWLLVVVKDRRAKVLLSLLKDFIG